MQSSISDVIESAPGVVSPQQAKRPTMNETAGGRKTATVTPQLLSLPEDVVTLSSSSEGAPPAKKTSQPVSNEERKALLHPNSPHSSFSVYG
ncbi:hypothetical protein AOG2_20000 [Geobacter sp. AOG2]|nr:hypothetical protein AOG2_20000 [Geobacter sp. AOG2]